LFAHDWFSTASDEKSYCLRRKISRVKKKLSFCFPKSNRFHVFSVDPWQRGRRGDRAPLSKATTHREHFANFLIEADPSQVPTSERTQTHRCGDTEASERRWPLSLIMIILIMFS
jgi:hypothetical protein